MMNIFEILSIFDWVGPVIETGKDIAWAVNNNEGGTTLDTKGASIRRLRDNGVTIISMTKDDFGRVIMIDVPDSQAAYALDIINRS